MKNKESTAQEQDEHRGVRDHIENVRMAADFMERALKNAPTISLDVWANWKEYRRSVEDLIALEQIDR